MWGLRGVKSLGESDKGEIGLEYNIDPIFVNTVYNCSNVNWIPVAKRFKRNVILFTSASYNPPKSDK